MARLFGAFGGKRPRRFLPEAPAVSSGDSLKQGEGSCVQVRTARGGRPQAFGLVGGDLCTARERGSAPGLLGTGSAGSRLRLSVEPGPAVRVLCLEAACSFQVKRPAATHGASDSEAPRSGARFINRTLNGKRADLLAGAGLLAKALAP